MRNQKDSLVISETNIAVSSPNKNKPIYGLKSSQLILACSPSPEPTASKNRDLWLHDMYNDHIEAVYSSLLPMVQNTKMYTSV